MQRWGPWWRKSIYLTEHLSGKQSADTFQLLRANSHFDSLPPSYYRDRDIGISSAVRVAHPPTPPSLNTVANSELEEAILHLCSVLVMVRWCWPHVGAFIFGIHLLLLVGQLQVWATYSSSTGQRTLICLVRPVHTCSWRQEDLCSVPEKRHERFKWMTTF